MSGSCRHRQMISRIRLIVTYRAWLDRVLIPSIATCEIATPECCLVCAWRSCARSVAGRRKNWPCNLALRAATWVAWSEADAIYRCSTYAGLPLRWKLRRPLCWSLIPYGQRSRLLKKRSSIRKPRIAAVVVFSSAYGLHIAVRLCTMRAGSRPDNRCKRRKTQVEESPGSIGQSAR